MSLADEWDSLSTAAPAKAASLADEWDSIKPDAHAGVTSKALADTRSPIEELAANQLTRLGHSIVGGWQGLMTLASGGSLAAAADAVENPRMYVPGTGNKDVRSYEPEKDTAGATLVSAADSNLNPLNWPGLIAHKAGDVTMDVTGSPGAATLVETGLNAAPLLFGLKKGASRAEPKVVGSSSIADAKPADVPLAQVGQVENLDVPTVLRRAKVAVETPGRTPLTLVPKEGEPQPATPTPKPVLSLVPNEAPRAPAPGETPPQAATAQAEAAAPKFAEEAPKAQEGGKLPIPEQLRRAQLLQRTGLEDARKSAVEGDPLAASTDYQTSLMDNSAGRFAKAKLDQEKAALTGSAEQIVRDAGGSVGTDGQTLETRGHTILAPLEGFRQWFTDQTTGLYKAARERAAGQPLALGKFSDVLGTDSKFANTDTIELRKGIKARMKELGMVDNDGNALPATVEQAENLRQYIGEEWSPKSNGRIKELKNALDEDVTSAAGEDIYKQARALHAMKQSIFADPKGLSSILDSEGINRKVPIEKVADTITALPNAQLAHIVETLKHVPPELQPQAQAALAEIKSHMASRVMDAGGGGAGQWNARAVSDYLNKNAAKMPLLFSPEEMAKFADLNDAGHILAKPQGYPGAAVQAHNLLQRGAMATLPKAGAMAGATVGTLFGAPGTGALVGDALGASAAGKLGEASALKATQKRWTKLSDVAK